MSHRTRSFSIGPGQAFIFALAACVALDAGTAGAAGRVRLALPAASISPSSVGANDGAGAPEGDEEMLEVMVDEDVARAAAIRDRILDDTRRLLRAHEVELGGEHRVRLTIGVGGTQQAFRVAIGVMRDGKLATPSQESFTCECTLEELRVQIDRGVVALLPVLGGKPADAAAGAGAAPPPDAGASPAAERKGKRRPLGRLGVAGVVILPVGLATVAVGAVLLGSPRKLDTAPGDLEGTGELTDLRPPGFAVLGVGIGVAIAGIALLAVDRTRARRGRSTARHHAPSLVPGVAPGSLDGRGDRPWSFELSLVSRF